MFTGATAFNKGFTMTTSWTGAGGATATNMFQGATAWLARYDPPTAGSVDGPASAWSVKLCAANEYVSSNACAACPAGNLRNAGDNPDGADTACTTCAADYYVSSGVCTACATGLFRLAGDDYDGSDTACTYASPFASKAELVNTIASSYCLGARRHRSYVHGRQGRCDRELGC